MYKLHSSLLIGKGLHRECYIHPENSNLCIKIVVAGCDSETLREQAYYEFLEKRNVSWKMLPKFYGNVETNLGFGAVFDLIRDYDGEVSKTLEDYLSSAEETKFHFCGLSKAIPSLKCFLIQEKVITMTLKAKNIVYKRINDTEGILVIVDNIGNSDFIPICNYVNFFAKKKILRKWQHFELTLLATYPHNKMLQRMLTSSHC